MMDARSEDAFGAHLRRARLVAGLTQHDLARRAGLSERGLSDLERGVSRTARRETALLLADALSLTGEQRDHFLQAARRRAIHEAVPRRDSSTLPVIPTTWIGREEEITALVQLLHAPGVRLVTVTGVGGIGKTRLALEAVRRLVNRFADGVCFIDLSSIADANLVGAAIARGLGLVGVEDEASEAALVAHLGGCAPLLVLDNFEHVMGATPLIARLLTRCPGLTLLITSRQPLRIRGEREFAVPALTLPDPRRLEAGAEQADAVALFVERLRDVRPEFALSNENVQTVSDVCLRLEGVPLAIELAAARGNLFSPAELLKRMEHRLDMLTSGPRDVPPRQRTMRDAIAWSYELLGPEEQTLFRRIAVFVSGVTIEAANWVAGRERPSLAPFLPVPASPHAPMAAAPLRDLIDTLDGLSALVDRSLLQRLDVWEEETRLRMLETVREFALERLMQSGESEDIRSRHAAYFLAMADAAASHLHGPQQRNWLDRLEREHDNVRAALGWAVASANAELALRFCGALGQFWRTRGHLSEGRRWCQRALNLPQGATPQARADALHTNGMLTHWQGDYDQTEALYKESLALRQAINDRRGIALSLNSLGILADDLGDYARALDLQEQSLHCWEDLGDDWGIAHTLCDLGNVAKIQGRFAAAEALYQRSLALFAQCEDQQAVAIVLDNLGETALRQGDVQRAAACLDDAIQIQRGLGYQQLVARHLDKLGMVRNAEGQLDDAEALHEESLALQQMLGDRRGMAASLLHLGDAARARGDASRAAARYRESIELRWQLQHKAGLAACFEDLAALVAATAPLATGRLYGAAQALRDALGAPLTIEHDVHMAGVATARAAISEDALQRAWSEGAALPLADAVTAALTIAGQVEKGRIP